MNITELDSYNLADAVKFNDTLNPRIWDGEKMRPEVRDKLLEIAADFKESLGLNDLDVEDITVSGSNAGYTYTPHSDIDLHLVVRMPEQCDDVYQELFNAKKYQYNNEHDIKIGGYDVELYVQPADQEHVSAGVYSLKNDDWIHIPRKIAAKADDAVVKDKYDLIKSKIDSALKSKDIDRMKAVWDKIKEMRKAGLAKNGELGPENLTFKMLRTQGDLGELKDTIRRARDAELSLAEQNKEKKPFVYGYKNVVDEDATATPDGVNPTTRMFLSEKPVPPHEEIIKNFIRFARKEIGLKKLPKFKLHKSPDWSVKNQSFGRYTNDTDTIDLAIGDRHIMDILRTLAHELQHRVQDERETMPPDAGETGSPYENEAHAVAGVVMRKFADMHPEYFEDVPVNEASGYIPTKAQANDSRFKMALTVDVHPGQTGKEANKMALKTDKQGKPGLLIKSANLQEGTAKKSYGYNSTPLSQVPGEQEDDLGNQEATGPEFEPQMPAGTTKVDVSDLTDWYRLGMDISDMDDADPKDYNQGPPQTVIVFPSDEAEQGYLKQFKRLGLKTHDIDPDVEGGEDLEGKHLEKRLAEELEAFKDQDLFEIKMTGKNLAKLASDIKGVKVGLEFEMIVPNATVEDDGDMEPDYDEDERVRDIDDCVSFFDDGDYNTSNELRRLRSSMESDFFDWQIEQLDQAWHNDGFEFFQEYLDREEPFDRDEALEEAEDYVRENNPDMEPGSDEYSEAVTERLNEMEANYAVAQWEEQGRNYDYAREEFDDEQRDNFSESDWLSDQGIRYASDVQNNYGDVTWPYYTSNSSEGEADIERIALEFMNESGLPYDSVAVSSSYHGTYKKWVGNGWVSVGSNKPDDCFSIEPDGSLDGNSSDDVGLEFVSPPIPLDQVGDVMSKVQQWAGANGVYTGKNNKTSMHTNISVPGYDLDKLDYLKAALLLGDEYVLREFDRIGNSYAKPAVEKIKQLVNQKPEKAKELLDKMKSQLNAEASKLIHSGVTDKFTSINTKDNRIEFRSPGGDYLSDIADNPKKMQDMINRMVVVMDAAMDPNKYKEEYQKKLYKVLTGQQAGREAKSGAKQEPKKDTNDLLNIFSRYAAGELPKAALKSFVRQAQLQRKVAKGEDTGKMWWNVKYAGQRMEVVATNKGDAKVAAVKEWGLTPAQAQLISATDITPLRPYEEKPEQSQQGGGLYKIYDTRGTLIAGDEYGSDRAALARAGVWAMQRGVDVVVKNSQGQEIGRVSASGEITPTAQQPTASTDQGNWGIWINANDRFANRAGSYARGETPPLYRFPSREAAEQWIEQQRAERPNMRTDIEVREIEPARQPVGDINLFPEIEPIPGSTLDLQRQRADQASNARSNLIPHGPGPWELASMANNQVYFNPTSTDRQTAETEARTWIQQMGLDPAEFVVRTRETASNRNAAQVDDWSQDFERRMQQGGTINTATEPTTGSEVGQTYNPSGTGSFTGQWLILNPTNQVIYRFGGIGNSQSDANRHAMNWLTQNTREMVDGVTVVPEIG